MNRHFCIKPHKCYYNEFHKCFVTLQELKKLILFIHTNENLYICKVNTKTFVAFNNSKTHLNHMNKVASPTYFVGSLQISSIFSSLQSYSLSTDSVTLFK